MNNLDRNKRVNHDLMKHLEHRIRLIKDKFICMDDDDLAIESLVSLLHFLLCSSGHIVNYYILNLFITIHHYLSKNNKFPEIKKEIEFCMELIEQNQKEL